MALPVIGAAFIGILISRIVAGIVALLVWKITIRIAIIAALIYGYNLAIDQLDALASQINIATTNPIILKAMMIFPSNTNDMIAIITSAYATRMMFDFGRAILDVHKV